MIEPDELRGQDPGACAAVVEIARWVIETEESYGHRPMRLSMPDGLVARMVYGAQVDAVLGGSRARENWVGGWPITVRVEGAVMNLVRGRSEFPDRLELRPPSTRLVVAPAELDAAEGEVYRALRDVVRPHEGLGIEEATVAARVIVGGGAR